MTWKTQTSLSKDSMNEGEVMTDTTTIERLKERIDSELGTSDWFTIDQALIDAFADVTQDHQYIHVDVERAKSTPFGGTIAHGLLTLSMIVHLCFDFVPKLPGTRVLLNYGFNRVRFPSPVRSGQRVRAKGRLASVDDKAPNQYLMVLDVTIEIEGQSKPAVVAEWLTYHVVGDENE